MWRAESRTGRVGLRILFHVATIALGTLFVLLFWMLPAATALECATINGARALGLEARIGSIEVGKEADLVAIEMASPEVSPLFDPVSHLLYASGREHVTDVWVAGRHVVQTRQLLTTEGNAIDQAVVSSSSAWQNRCRQLLRK